MDFLICALIAGLIILLVCGRLKGLSWNEIFHTSLDGVKKTKKILLVCALIGLLTGLWRASGTIPVIIAYASKLIHPSYFVIAAFLLNCAVSFLTGTAFGTAATMGSICMVTAAALQVNPLWTGGAVMSGVYFGDRCSPMSTSALLVSTLTETDLYDNIKTMFRTALLPFALSCLFYLLIGLQMNTTGKLLDIFALFKPEFSLELICFLPAAFILILSVLKIPVTTAMSISILTAFIIAHTVQNLDFTELLSVAILGYHAHTPELGEMINGGGFISMYRVATVTCIVSCYSGLLEKLGMLSYIQSFVTKLSQKISPHGAILVASILTGALVFNQTLTILITHQICKDLKIDAKKMAAILENTAVVIAPLIPWSIACTTPLASINAPAASMLFAFYLYLIPVCDIFSMIAKNFKANMHLIPVKH